MFDSWLVERLIDMQILCVMNTIHIFLHTIKIKWRKYISL